MKFDIKDQDVIYYCGLSCTVSRFHKSIADVTFIIRKKKNLTDCCYDDDWIKKRSRECPLGFVGFWFVSIPTIFLHRLKNAGLKVLQQKKGKKLHQIWVQWSSRASHYWYLIPPGAVWSLLASNCPDVAYPFSMSASISAPSCYVECVLFPPSPGNLCKIYFNFKQTFATLQVFRSESRWWEKLLQKVPSSFSVFPFKIFLQDYLFLFYPRNLIELRFTFPRWFRMKTFHINSTPCWNPSHNFHAQQMILWHGTLYSSSISNEKRWEETILRPGFHCEVAQGSSA